MGRETGRKTGGDEFLKLPQIHQRKPPLFKKKRRMDEIKKKGKGSGKKRRQECSCSKLSD